MLHEMRVPSQPDTTPTQTSPIDNIKNRLKRINDIYDNMKRSYNQTQTQIHSIMMTGTPMSVTSALKDDQSMDLSWPSSFEPEEPSESNTPTPMNQWTQKKLTIPHTFSPSMSCALTWSLPTQNQFRMTASNPHQIQKPTGGPPPPAPPPGPPAQLPNIPWILIRTYDDPLQGKEPSVFNGDRLKTDKFLHKLRLYQFVNDLYPIMQNPWHKVAHALAYLTGSDTYEWKWSVDVTIYIYIGLTISFSFHLSFSFHHWACTILTAPDQRHDPEDLM